MIFAFLMFSFLFSCSGQNVSYEDLSSSMGKILKGGFAEDMQDLADKITDEYIKSSDGQKFLKLKIEALCLADNQKLAIDVLSENAAVFSNLAEFKAVKGILLFREYSDDKGNFTEAIELFSKLQVENLSHEEITLFYYLISVLDDKFGIKKKQEIRANSTTSMNELFDFYDKQDQGSLLKISPVSYLPFYTLPKRSASSNKEWWKTYN